MTPCNATNNIGPAHEARDLSQLSQLRRDGTDAQLRDRDVARGEPRQLPLHQLQLHRAGHQTRLDRAGAGSSGAVNIDPSTGQVATDTRTPEQIKNDHEEAIATILSLVLGGAIAGPLIWHGLIVWWIALGLGIAVWIGMNKVFCGPLRIVPVIGRLFVTSIAWSLALAYGAFGIGVLGYIIYLIVTRK